MRRNPLTDHSDTDRPDKNPSDPDPSHVDAFLGMPRQIPAGHVSLARKQRVDAGPRLGRMKDELSLPAFLRYRVVAVHRDLSVGLAIRRDPVAEHSEVHGIGQRGETKSGGEPNHDHLQQPTFKFPNRHRGHRRAIIPAGPQPSGRWASLFLFPMRFPPLVDNSPLSQAN